MNEPPVSDLYNEADEILGMVGPETPAVHIERREFYAATRSEDLALVIVSGDRRWYANVLLTIGSTPEN